MIKLLRDIRIWKFKHTTCGDGCCYHRERGYKDNLKAGDVISDYDCADLDESIDYVEVEEN